MNFPELPADHAESPISFHLEDVELILPQEEALTAWLASIAEQEQKELIELNYIFCSDEHLLNINIEYLQHDYYTDVITFPYSETAVHGDVFISIDRVQDNATSLGVSFENELLRVMAHGALHLAGYDDKSPEKKAEMRNKEDFYLRQSTHLLTTL
jgi:rRNA maturation RNase YbeY